ncbi:DUF1499 domain-containing protein [Halomicronema hongdechloris]|uniref:DUF1499 domain-containing protein n=1 Tax=Halomicronema hongdechloris TaxID=1209493 RepID=UPI001CED014F|nr:DUF1499 domain-containing protein [Halomicronema hongdechloris]
MTLAVMLLVSAWLGGSSSALAASPHTVSGSPMYIAAIPGLSGLFAGTRPDTLGVQDDGRLAACPSSPNCVVSREDADAEHAIAPLTYSSDAATAMARLKQVLQGQPRTDIITEREDYLYAEARSRLMGFVDDVEFYLDAPNSVIQVRSASRLGQSDLGVNRDRIETIRAQFNDLAGT